MRPIMLGSILTYSARCTTGVASPASTAQLKPSDEETTPLVSLKSGTIVWMVLAWGGGGGGA